MNTRSFVLRGSVVFGLAVLVSFGAVFGDEAAKRLVTGEVPPAMDRLEKLYSQVSGSGTVKAYMRQVKKDSSGKITAIDEDRPEELLSEVKVEFQVQNDMRRVSVLRAPSDPGKRRIPAELVHCAGSDTQFILQRDEPGTPLTVKGLGSEQEAAMNGAFNDRLMWYLNSPFVINVDKISKFMNDKNFKIIDIHQVDKNGLKCYKVQFTCYQEKMRYRSGWIIFSPDNGWAVQECHASSDDPRLGALGEDALHVVIEYENPRSDKPVPKRVTHSTFKGLHRRVFELDRVSFDPVSSDSFTLAAFGLPDMGQPARRNSTNKMSYWLIGAAVLALLIAVALKYGSSRLRRARAPG